MSALVTLLAAGLAGAALADDDWTPQDMISQRQRFDVETRAANIYVHPPALAVQIESLAVLLVEADLPDGSAEQMPAIIRQWVPGRDQAGSFGPGWVASWEARAPDGVQVERDASGRVRALRGRGSVELDSDSAGRVVTARASDGRSARYTYGANGRLARVELSTGEFVAYEYDDRGRIASVQHEDGMRTTLTYGEGGYLASVAGPGRAVSSFQLRRSPEASFVTIVNAAGGARTWEFRSRSAEVLIHGPGELLEEKQYDDAGRLVRHVEPDGTATEFSYDAAGRPARAQRVGEPPETFSYDADGRLLAVDAPGGSVRATYNAEGLLETFTDRNGVTRYEYGADRTLAKLTLPDGRAVAVTSDAAGRVVGLAPDGGVPERFAYDAAGRPTSTEGPAGSWAYAYDERGRLISVQDPAAGTSRFEYGERSVTITGADGRTTLREWDESGRVLSERIQPGDEQRTFERDALGQAVAITTQSGSRHTFAYDEWGRLIDAAGSDGTRTTFEWSPVGELAMIRRAGGETVRFEYGPGGRVLRTASDQRGTAEYEYDGQGRIAVAREPGEPARRYAYDGAGRLVEIAIGDSVYRRTFDALGRVTSLRSPLGGEVRVEYDAAGLPSRMTDAAGNVTEFSYDAAGRPTGRRAPGRETRVTYDAAGRPATLESGGTTVRTQRYDAAGRLAGVETPTRRVAYAYDPTGALSERQDLTSGRTTRYETRNGLWTRVTLAGDVSLSCARNPHGAITRIEGPEGAAVTLERDAQGRRVRVSYGAVASAVTTYAENGLITEIRWTRADGSVIYRLAYEHDACGRITRADFNGRAVEYQYDDYGRLRSAASEVYTYDADGNLLGNGTEAWSCDAADRLTEATYDGEGRLVAGPAECEYDGEGRLARVSIGGAEIRYGYGPGGDLVSRTVGGVTEEFETLEGNRVAEVRDGRLSAVYLTGESPDERYAVITGGQVRYFITDPCGTVLGLIDGSGALAGTQSYSAFGVPLATGEPVGPFAFQGHYRDPATGWLFLRSRWYDPARGRFLQPDTAEPSFEEPETLNRYAFAFNDPVNHIDPWGYKPWVQPTVYTAGTGASEAQAVQQAFEQFKGAKPPPSGSFLGTTVPKGFQAGNYFAFGKNGIAYDVWTRVNGNGQVEVAFRPFDYAEGGYYRDPTKGFNQIEAGKIPDPAPPPSALSRGALRVAQAGGKVLLVYGAYRSLRNIWEAYDWKNQAARETAGWTGGLLLGAKLGAYGGPWGSLLGGLAGGVGGYFLGREGYDWATGTREDAHYISVALDQSDWYCTNRPEISAGVRLPDILAVERTRRLEALATAQRTEAEIRAAADQEAQRLQAEFERLLAELQERLDEVNRPLPAGNYSGGQLMMIEEQRRLQAETINERAAEAQALLQRSLRNLAVKTGREVDAVRAALAGELRPLPPPVIPPTGGPFGRPYGEPPSGVYRER